MAENHPLTLGSEPSDTEVPSVKKRERVQQIKRIFGTTALGFALVGAIAYLATSHSATTSLRSSSRNDIGQALQLDGDEKSTFYLIKHTFPKPDLAGPWWEKTKAMMADPDAFGKAVKSWHDAGFHNSYFLPTDAGGPFYCVWEAKAGKTKADMQAFIDSDSSPGGVMKNEVMPFDTKLTGGMVPFPSEFAAKTKSARRLEDASEGKDSFYLIMHEFKSSDDVDPWWEKVQKMMADPKAFGAMMKANEADGYHNIFMFPTAKAGPIFCLWEAKAGKTADDMTHWINTAKDSPASLLKNTVMPLPFKLLGGPPGVTIDGKPNEYFKWASIPDYFQ